MMTGSILTNVGIDISEVLGTCIGQRLVVAAPVAALNAIPIQSFFFAHNTSALSSGTSRSPIYFTDMQKRMSDTGLKIVLMQQACRHPLEPPASSEHSSLVTNQSPFVQAIHPPSFFEWMTYSKHAWAFVIVAVLQFHILDHRCFHLQHSRISWTSQLCTYGKSFDGLLHF